MYVIKSCATLKSVLFITTFSLVSSVYNSLFYGGSRSWEIFVISVLSRHQVESFINFVLGTFINVCQDNSGLVKLWLTMVVLETYVHLYSTKFFPEWKKFQIRIIEVITCFGQTCCPASRVLILYSQQMVFVILVMLTVCFHLNLASRQST